MFTGIVRGTGRITELKPSADGVTFRFECGGLYDDLDIGHSISVDGVCLTVTRKQDHWVEVDATPETLRKTNLGSRAVGAALNLEPAMRLTDFLGGHLVQGHVDGTGRVQSIVEEGNSWIFRFAVPDEVRRYCTYKGSITINGISLTISALGADYVEVAIIPHTMEVTNLAEARAGDKVNLEADVISKYVESHVRRFVGDPGGAASGIGPTAD